MSEGRDQCGRPFDTRLQKSFVVGHIAENGCIGEVTQPLWVPVDDDTICVREDRPLHVPLVPIHKHSRAQAFE